MTQQTATAGLGKNHLVAGIAGNVMEWYDFAVYGYFASIIAPMFFPSDDHVSSLLATFGVFAAGFLMRPIGAIVFGHLGDKMGRKAALMLSVISMAAPTFLLGCLPTYETIGILAPILLTVIRMVQGLSVGGEYTGSITYLTEATHHKNRGLAASWSSAGAMGGFVLGSGVAALITNLVPTDLVNDWFWRVPFLCGALIGIFAVMMRKNLPESESFEKLQAQDDVAEIPLHDAFRHQAWEMTKVVLYNWSPAAVNYVVFLYLPTYLHTYDRIPLSEALNINTIAIALVVVLIPTFAWLSDKGGRYRMVMLTQIACALLAYPLFMLFDVGTIWAVLAGQAVFAVLVGLQQGLNPAFMVEQFARAGTRFTALSLSFNTAYALFGGTAPLIASWLIHATGDHRAVAIYLAATSVVSLGAILLLRDHAGKKMS